MKFIQIALIASIAMAAKLGGPATNEATNSATAVQAAVSKAQARGSKLA